MIVDLVLAAAVAVVATVEQRGETRLWAVLGALSSSCQHRALNVRIADMHGVRKGMSTL